MNVVNTGSIYRLYDESMRTFDRLPAQTYVVNFNQMQGFYLKKGGDIEVDERVYGIHGEKVEKVMRSFGQFERNLGVILSGPKGIGKSLFAKMLAARAIELDYPVIVANEYIPGIANYLASIKQEIVVLFDEFDKTFFSKDDRGSASDPQTEMLTLFDGMVQGKKLFVITCNELNNLSDYLVNRPGRFHYHYRFEYPSPEEIREYLVDSIPEKMQVEIGGVISFSRKVALNYDCLRAIAFELSNGLPFDEAIRDLNIVNLRRESYVVVLRFKDGKQDKGEMSIDMFEDEVTLPFDDDEGHDFDVIFDPKDAVYSHEFDGVVLPGEKIKIEWDERDWGKDEESQREFERCKAREIDCLIIRRRGTKRLHYSI